MRKGRSGQRQFDAEVSAAAGKRIDKKTAAEARDAFLHTKKTHAALTARIKADAVVFDGKEKSVILLLDEDTDAPGVSVFDAIVEGFLDDTIDASAMVFGKVVSELTIDDVDDKASAFGDFAALPLEGGDEAEVVEHGGA